MLKFLRYLKSMLFRPFCWLVILALSAVLTSCQFTKREPAITELRGVWITNVASNVLDSRESIEEAMKFLAQHHFNVIYPVVWNDAYTIYPSELMDSLFAVKIDPRFAGRDPLAELIEAAGRYGIAVVPWFEYGFASSYQKDGGRLLKKFPHWAARDAEGRLLTKNGFEWMNAYHPEVQAFLLSMIREVITHYEVEGIQGDDRLPAQPSEGGYADYTRLQYVASTGDSLPLDPKDTAWLRWRADKLTEFAGKVYRLVKETDPGIMVTWSPSIFPWSYEEYLQDWPAWMRNGHTDFVHPQNYRYSFDRYKVTVDMLHPDSLNIPHALVKQIYPGILMKVDNHLITPEYLLAALGYNRARGFKGEVFFFYEGLRANNNMLADTLLSTWYAKPAVLPKPFKMR